MRIVARGATDMGRVRDHNEDFYLVDDTLGLYVVCDGMGGHAAGEVASQTAAEKVRDYLTVFKDDLVGFEDSPSARRQLERLVRRAMEEACRVVYDMAQQDSSKAGMGTTMSLMLVRGHAGVMGHVGDSRVYLCRDERLHQLSQDHTFVAEMVRGGAPLEKAMKSNMAHVLTRSIGYQANVEVDTLVLELLDGDRLLLCSDGIVGHVGTPPDIGPMLARGCPPEHFIDFANARGGADNSTAVVLEAQHAADTDLARDRDQRVRHKLGTVGEIFLFDRLDLREIALITSRLGEVDVRPGEVVIREGSAGDRLFIVLKGTLTVSRAGQSLASMGPGEHFGEMALVSGRARNATVVADTDAELVVMERADFVRLINQHPRLGVKLLWTLGEALIERLDPHGEEADAEADQTAPQS